jgi:hypothetical protein
MTVHYLRPGIEEETELESCQKLSAFVTLIMSPSAARPLLGINITRSLVKLQEEEGLTTARYSRQCR